MTVEVLASRWRTSFKPGKGDFLFTDAQQSGERITLMIPTSYMNRSGGPVVGWMNYYKINPSDAVIIYDDHDLPLGRIRLRERGSSGGHWGMDDIIRLAGTEDIPRLRIGIRTSVEQSELSYQVLSKIPNVHTNFVKQVIDIAADAMEMTVAQGITTAMNHFNNYEID